MTTEKYTPEQIKDITEREAKGLQALKDLQLTPACAVQKINVGNDVFADKVNAYLQDTKYTEFPTLDIPVPEQEVEELPVEEVKETLSSDGTVISA